MKKIINTGAASLLLASTLLSSAIQAADFELTDIEGSYAKDAIRELVDKGIISGQENGTFNPGDQIRRQDFAIILTKALNLDVSAAPAQPTFADVPPTDYAYNYVEAAAKAGLVNGIGDGIFGNGSHLTREGMAVLFVRSLGLKAEGKQVKTVDVSAPRQDTDGSTSESVGGAKKVNPSDALNEMNQFLSGANLPYKDAPEISDFASHSVALAAQLGLMSGGSDNKFDPHADADRQQVAVAVSNFLKVKQASRSEFSSASIVDRNTVRVTFSKPVIGLLSSDIVLTNQKTGEPIPVKSIALSPDGMSAAIVVSDIAVDRLISVAYNTPARNESNVVTTTNPPTASATELAGNEAAKNPVSDPAQTPQLQTGKGSSAGGGGGGGEGEKTSPSRPRNNNQIPVVINKPADIVTQTGRRTTFWTTIFRDPDGDNLTFSAQSSNPAVVAVTAAPDLLTLNSIAGGEATITVSATDRRGASVETSFAVKVNLAKNHSPVEAQRLIDYLIEYVGVFPHVIDARNVFTDADNDPITLTVEQSNPAVAAVEINGNVLKISSLTPGSTMIKLAASDGKGGNAESLFVFEAITVNSVSLLGKKMLISSIIEAQARYNEAVVGVNPGQYPSTAKQALLHAINTVKAVYRDEWAFEAVFGALAILGDAIQEFELSVIQDKTPPSTVTNLVYTQADLTTIRLKWTKAEDNVGTTGYKVYQNNRFIRNVLTSAADVSCDVTGLVPGAVDKFEVSAFDAAGNEGSRAALTKGTPDPANHRPNAHGMDPVAIALAHTGTLDIVQEGAFDDPDGDMLTYQATSSNPAIATVSVSGTTLTITPVAAGSSTITLTAYDLRGGKASTTIAVNVN